MTLEPSDQPLLVPQSHMNMCSHVWLATRTGAGNCTICIVDALGTKYISLSLICGTNAESSGI